MSFCHHREEKTDYVYPFLEQPGCKILGNQRIVQHDRYDGVLAGLDVESGMGHLGPEIFGIVFQLVPEFGGPAQHIEYGNRSADDTGCQCIGEQVRTAALAKHFNNLFFTGSEAPAGAT